MTLTDKFKKKVINYQPDQKALDRIRQAPILLTCGITGAGKNAVLNRLRQGYPDLYHFILSHVTRPKRDYEVQDVHYHFVDFSTIEEMVDEKAFVEVDIVHTDYVYGTSIAEIERIESANQIACTDVTIRGVDDYIALDLNIKAVFLLPPSYEVWKKRLLARYESAGEMNRRDLRNRLQSALEEIEHALKTYHFYIVINDDLEHTAHIVHKIATGEPVEPHYHKAMHIAEEIAGSIKEAIKRLE
ncbi:MAG TPA: hypothetical protein VIS56_02405 [Candidatus Saccharimonadales bacterium]